MNFVCDPRVTTENCFSVFFIPLKLYLNVVFISLRVYFTYCIRHISRISILYYFILYFYYFIVYFLFRNFFFSFLSLKDNLLLFV